MSESSEGAPAASTAEDQEASPGEASSGEETSGAGLAGANRTPGAFIEDLRQELSRVIVGQRYMVERLIIGMLTNGHVLLEGVPGLAKTLTVRSLADCIDLDFQRIQFTPDLLPADLVGTMIYNPESKDFEPRKGPVFTNVLLADEINRAPAKVQSALLQSMQEREVTLGDTTYDLPHPFLVLATQNPMEQEGTYPLPEAQIDRFMLMIKVGYPTRDEERLIMDRMAEPGGSAQLSQVASLADIERGRRQVRGLRLDAKLKDYIIQLIFATREPRNFGLDHLEDFIEYGASPRATIQLNLGAKAHAFVDQRDYVMPEDIKSIAFDVLRHRVILTYEAEAEEYTPERVIEELLENIEVP